LAHASKKTSGKHPEHGDYNACSPTRSKTMKETRETLLSLSGVLMEMAPVLS
jgi:hypothetical protein